MSLRALLLPIAVTTVPFVAEASCSPPFPPVAAHVASSPANTSLAGLARWIEMGFAAQAAERLQAIVADDSQPAATRLEARALLAAAASQLGDDRFARTLAASVYKESSGIGAAARAAILLRLASVYLRAGLVESGVKLLEESESLARQAGDRHLERLAAFNLARAPAADEVRRARIARLLASPFDAEPAELRLAILRVAVEGGGADEAVARRLAEEFARASNAQDAATAAEAMGALAEWHRLRGNLPAAIEAAERALALASSVGKAGAVEWAWTRARAHAAAGASAPALEAYARAADLARASRAVAEPSLLALGVTYRQRYGELFLEYADALLASSAARAVEERQRALRAVIEVVETSKAVEIADFFRDPCIAPEAPVLRADAVDRDSAVLYPVIFRDRTELLLSHREGIDRFTANVGRDELAKRVDRFRELLEKRTTRQYLRPARELHQLLVAPLEPRLESLGTKVLVVVPDGALRTVPFAALHDGKRHLVERLAVGTSPGLSLTSPQRLAAQRLEGVVQGLTVARHGFSALPAVDEELDRIASTLSAKPIRDAEFTRSRLERELGRSRANVVHIASHGQFSSDLRDTFLLAYDEKVDLDSLRRAISAGKTKEEPLELLTLSACQTAVGDERAALGLAGVALRAGARSALASLWSVSDESTAELIARFYVELAVERRSRAEALRAAQLHLLADERFAHAAYWGAFLLIGSWL